MAVRFEEAQAAAAATRQRAGAPTRGEFRCSECGYGVVVRDELPVCPMCRGTTWESVLWSPFTRARREWERSEAEALWGSHF